MSIKQDVKDYYESHRYSFQQIADSSINVFSEKVTVDQIKKWSQEDGGWHRKQLDDNEKMGIIAERIFETIENNPDLSPKDLSALANTYLSIVTKGPMESAGRKPTLQEIIDATKGLNVDSK